MPRTTKGNLKARKHKAVIARTKGIMELGLDYLKLQSNLLLNPCNMPIETEKIEKEISEDSGSQESMLK